MTSKEEQEEIDFALDAALDELDDDEEEQPKHAKNELPTTEELSTNDNDAADSTAASTKSLSSKSQEGNNSQARPMMGPPRPPAADEKDEEKMMSDMMQQMLRLDQQGGDAPDEFLGQLMQDMQSQLGSEPPSLDRTPRKEKSDARAGKSKDKGSTPSNEGGVDQAISSLLEGMAKEKLNDEGVGNEPSMTGEADMLESLMQGLGGDGGDYNADAMIDGMMEQLMSKDLMYEPIKQFATSFPPWLEERRDNMPKEEYSKYVFHPVFGIGYIGLPAHSLTHSLARPLPRCCPHHSRRRKQCECFKMIVNAYDTEPENTSKIMALMQENQEYVCPLYSYIC
jgi:peroxin-19